VSLPKVACNTGCIRARIGKANAHAWATHLKGDCLYEKLCFSLQGKAEIERQGRANAPK